MTNDAVGRIALDIFGAVMASVSHEVKNRMAVINEHAGLIEDYAKMAERQDGVDAGAFRRSAEKIKLQVELANEIIKNMNRFAHSVDNAIDQISLYDAAVLAASLFQRKASANQVSIDVRSTREPVVIKRSLYHVLGLIWLCLEAVAVIAAANSAVTISFEKQNDECLLIIGIESVAEQGPDDTLPAAATALAQSINADVVIDADKSKVVVRFL